MIALVTGGSRGIGKAIAKRLLDLGYHVRICARHKGEIDACVAELKKSGSIDGGVLDLADRKAIFQYCKAWSGPLDLLVNNAGLCHVQRIQEGQDAWLEDATFWDEVINVNLAGAHFLTKGLLRHIPDNGRIVNIASQLGVEARAGYGAYCASKFGLIGLTKCWAKELGARGITVNAVLPGWVATDQAKGDMERIAREKGESADELYQQVCAPLELKRFTTPEEIANLVAFLASREASGVTGRDWLLNTIWNQE
jgi:NAD(P)-dependent dehydrogenase (short-subunit alcohol dehydrogenase family)